MREWQGILRLDGAVAARERDNGPRGTTERSIAALWGIGPLASSEQAVKHLFGQASEAASFS